MDPRYALGPMLWWAGFCGVFGAWVSIYVLPVEAMPLGFSISLTLVVISYIEIAPPFVTRAEVRHREKLRGPIGWRFEDSTVVPYLLHRVRSFPPDKGKRRRTEEVARDHDGIAAPTRA